MNQQQNIPSQQEIVVSADNEDEIDILDLIRILGEEKWLLFGLPFICSCVAVVISLNQSPMYTAKATFVVPDRQSSASSVVLDTLGGLGGLAGSLSKSPIEMYVAFMQSNTVQDEIIIELDLMQHYQTISKEIIRKKLLNQIKITTDKRSGLITIEAQDKSADIAAKLANSYLKPFRAFLNRMSLEEAHLRRDFFAQQISVISQRPFRDPFVQSTLMNSMIKQYEAARIDEARESQILFPVDVAKSPESRSSPKRTQFVLIVTTGAFFLTLLMIFIKRVFRHAQSNSDSSLKWVNMKKAWKLRL